MATASGAATVFTNERATTTGAKANAISVAITFTLLRPA